MHCGEIQELLPWYPELLEDEQVKVIHSHLRDCPICRREYLLMGEMTNEIKNQPLAVNPDKALVKLQQSIGSDDRLLASAVIKLIKEGVDPETAQSLAELYGSIGTDLSHKGFALSQRKEEIKQ